MTKLIKLVKQSDVTLAFDDKIVKAHKAIDKMSGKNLEEEVKTIQRQLGGVAKMLKDLKVTV